MVIVKHKNGTKTKIKANKDVLEEMLESVKKIKKDIDEVFISRTITTKTEEERSKLKDLCTKYQIDVMPLDRTFIKHKIFIREDSLKEVFRKLIILKTFFKNE